jgi:hypothetical protein
VVAVHHEEPAGRRRAELIDVSVNQCVQIRGEGKLMCWI